MNNFWKGSWYPVFLKSGVFNWCYCTHFNLLAVIILMSVYNAHTYICIKQWLRLVDHDRVVFCVPTVFCNHTVFFNRKAGSGH